MNDVILILQMKQGDEQAFDKFVRKYYGDILSYCKYHCLDQTEAEDLTQETFLRFMNNQDFKLKEIADILQIGLPLVKYRHKKGKKKN